MKAEQIIQQLYKWAKIADVELQGHADCWYLTLSDGIDICEDGNDIAEVVEQAIDTLKENLFVE